MKNSRLLVHVGDNPVQTSSRDLGVWIPLADALKSLQLASKDLGGGSIGLCPSPDVCIPVPSAAIAQVDGVTCVDLESLTSPLGLVLVRDDYHSAVIPGGASVSSRADVGKPLTLELPNIFTGKPVSLAVAGCRTAVFAWASW